MAESLPTPDDNTIQIAAREVQALSDAYVAKYPDQPKPVEGGIIRPVVALRAHGFNTGGSCEGHWQYVASLPFITVAPDDQDDHDIDPKAWEAKLRMMGSLLNEFYDEHQPIRRRITIWGHGRTGYLSEAGHKLPQHISLSCTWQQPEWLVDTIERLRYLLLPEPVKQWRVEQDRSEFDFFAAFLERKLGCICPRFKPEWYKEPLH